MLPLRFLKYLSEMLKKKILMYYLVENFLILKFMLQFDGKNFATYHETKEGSQSMMFFLHLEIVRLVAPNYPVDLLHFFLDFLYRR